MDEESKARKSLKHRWNAMI